MGVKITYSGAASGPSPSAKLVCAKQPVQVAAADPAEVVPALAAGLAAMQKTAATHSKDAGAKPNPLAAMFKKAKKTPQPVPPEEPATPPVESAQPGSSTELPFPPSDLVIGFADGSQQVIPKEVIAAQMAEQAAMENMVTKAFEGIADDDPDGLSKAMAKMHAQINAGVEGFAPPPPPEPYKALPPDQQAPYDHTDPKAFKKVLASFYRTLTAPKGKKPKQG